MQQQISESERDAIFKKLQANPDNNKCFDCEKKNPKWSSVYFGIYLCLDCAGKHREYGVQISFVRSVNLDTWNKKYLTHMELGGNTKAHEYFQKQGIKTPYDYKSSFVQKYKQELIKKAEASLANNNGAAKEEQAIFTHQPGQEQAESPKLKEEKATTQKAPENPFANTVVINKTETKTKGFSVEFNKNKPTFSSNKGRLAAKKIDNIDLDALSLNEDGGPTYTKNQFEMSSDAFPMNGKTAVRQIETKGNAREEPSSDKLKQFQNAKAISSESFKNNESWNNASNVRKFAGSNAISSDQYFGRRQEVDADEMDFAEAAHNFGAFLSNIGQEIKRQAEEEWNF